LRHVAEQIKKCDCTDPQQQANDKDQFIDNILLPKINNAFHELP